MHYGKINPCDIANGLGVRVSLFVSGCRRHCPGCFQPETWAFDYGQPYTQATEDEIIRLLRPSYIDGLSILGGEPFELENQLELVRLVARVRRELPGKDFWCYTGYKIEELLQSPLLPLVDVLVDGPFVEAEKDISLAFRGSRNQRIINVRDVIR